MGATNNLQVRLGFTRKFRIIFAGLVKAAVWLPNMHTHAMLTGSNANGARKSPLGVTEDSEPFFGNGEIAGQNQSFVDEEVEFGTTKIMLHAELKSR